MWHNASCDGKPQNHILGSQKNQNNFWNRTLNPIDIFSSKKANIDGTHTRCIPKTIPIRTNGVNLKKHGKHTTGDVAQFRNENVNNNKSNDKNRTRKQKTKKKTRQLARKYHFGKRVNKAHVCCAAGPMAKGKKNRAYIDQRHGNELIVCQSVLWNAKLDENLSNQNDEKYSTE